MRTSRPRTYDLAVVGRLDSVTAPKQARSEQSLQRVLGALESLLESKAFTDISIPEIAARSGCSAATIYGRFKDKHAILASLHESLRKRMVDDLDALLDPAQWRGKPLSRLTDRFCTCLVSFYRQDRNMLAAVLVMGERELYERAAENIHHASQCFCAAVQAVVDGGLDRDALHRCDLGVRAIFALLQQRLLFHPVSFGPHAGQSDAAFAAELSALIQLSLRASA